MKRILVLGAGVIGLTTALRLLEDPDNHVTIHSHTSWRASTSSKAAALWEPYRPQAGRSLPAQDHLLIAQWGKQAYTTFEAEAGKRDSGVKGVTVLALKRDPGLPEWAEDADLRQTLHPRPALEKELAGHSVYAGACLFESIVIDMPHYLRRLEQAIEARRERATIEYGAPVERDRLAAVSERFDALVNCTGLGARRLVDAEEATELQGMRGQIVRLHSSTFPSAQVGADEAVASVFLDIDQPTARKGAITYIVPRFNDIVLGGYYEPLTPRQTALHERRNEGQRWGLAKRKAILRRCAGLLAFLHDLSAQHPASIRMRHSGCIEQLENYAVAPGAVSGLDDDGGLRPYRDSVRVEPGERLSNGCQVIHNYGHGGAGVTLSWGCAQSVADMVRRL